MLGTALAIIAVIASGPAFGFAALWLGCRVTSALGTYYGHNGLLTLIVLVVIGWLVAIAAVAALSGRAKRKGSA
jgi:hypothetical protein